MDYAQSALTFASSQEYLPSIGEVVTRRDSNKVLMSMLEHFIEASLPRLQALIEKILEGGLGVASRRLGGIIGAQSFLNTLEGGTSPELATSKSSLDR
jgi:hypothetical protein